MTADEKVAWHKKLEGWKKKQEMAKLMEKNLDHKRKHGAKPIEPPQPATLLGKAKKAAHTHAEQSMANKPAGPPANETLKQRIERQAMASAQGAGTGGATAVLGADIAKSKMNQDLAKKREAFEKKQAADKAKEEEERKRAESAKIKAKPKGLKDFLDKNPEPDVPGAAPAAAAGAVPTSPLSTAKPGLRAFLSQSEHDEPADSRGAPASSAAAGAPKVSNLQAFLSSNVSESEPVADKHAQQLPKTSNLQAFLSSSSAAGAPATPVASPVMVVTEPARTLPSSPVASTKNSLAAFLSSSSQPSADPAPVPSSPIHTPKPLPTASPVDDKAAKKDEAEPASETAARLEAALATPSDDAAAAAASPAADEPPAASQDDKPESFVRRASRRVSTTVKKLLGRDGANDDDNAGGGDAGGVVGDAVAAEAEARPVSSKLDVTEAQAIVAADVAVDLATQQSVDDDLPAASDQPAEAAPPPASEPPSEE